MPMVVHLLAHAAERCRAWAPSGDRVALLAAVEEAAEIWSAEFHAYALNDRFLHLVAGLPAGTADGLLRSLGAAIAHGELLRTWDEPIQRFVEGNRTELTDQFFLMVSSMGSTVTVLALGTAFAALTWKRCRAVSVAIVIAMLARPPIEATLKFLVDRDRPDFERLKSLLNQPVVFDGRNIYSRKTLEGLGFTYYGIGT